MCCHNEEEKSPCPRTNDCGECVQLIPPMKRIFHCTNASGKCKVECSRNWREYAELFHTEHSPPLYTARKTNGAGVVVVVERRSRRERNEGEE